jgi:hypothetical protein
LVVPGRVPGQTRPGAQFAAFTPIEIPGDAIGEETLVIEIPVAPASGQLRSARRAVRAHMDPARFDAEHIGAVEAVANELLGAAFDGGAKAGLVLSVETFTLLTSVRVHCPNLLHLRDEPFGMRERVLEGFAFAWGTRIHANGSVDLWAELARPTR